MQTGGSFVASTLNTASALGLAGETGTLEVGKRADLVLLDTPRLEADAVKLTAVSHLEVLNRGLKVMDSTAITFCMDNRLPIIVFDVSAPGNIRRSTN